MQTFTLTVTGGGTGNGTVTAPATAGQAAINCTLTAGVATGTCAGTYPSGTGLTLTATAAANHTFAGWSGGACAGTGTCVLTMTQARTVTASFTAPANDPCNPVALAFPGTVNGNVSAAGCVVNGLPAAIYRFTATGQGGSTFSATATFPVQISVMSDPPGSNIVFTGPAATPNSASFEWLLPPTSFQFKVASRTAGTGGTFSLTGSVTSGNSPSCPVSGTIIRAFVVGGTYSGQSLGAGDCTANDGSYEDGYYIYSTKPCTITMTPTGFDAFLAIYDASTGNNLTFSDNLGIGGAETVQLPACSNGGNALLIIANTFNAGETGTYVLAITITGGGSLTARDPGETVPALTPPLVHQDAATILQRLSLPKKKKN